MIIEFEPRKNTLRYINVYIFSFNNKKIKHSIFFDILQIVTLNLIR